MDYSLIANRGGGLKWQRHGAAKDDPSGGLAQKGRSDGDLGRAHGGQGHGAGIPQNLPFRCPNPGGMVGKKPPLLGLRKHTSCPSAAQREIGLPSAPSPTGHAYLQQM